MRVSVIKKRYAIFIIIVTSLFLKKKLLLFLFNLHLILIIVCNICFVKRRMELYFFILTLKNPKSLMRHCNSKEEEKVVGIFTYNNIKKLDGSLDSFEKIINIILN